MTSTKTQWLDHTNNTGWKDSLSDWIDPSEFEIRYGFKKSTQAKYRMLGLIPFAKIGKFIRYDAREIEAWIASHRVGGVQ